MWTLKPKLSSSAWNALTSWIQRVRFWIYSIAVSNEVYIRLSWAAFQNSKWSVFICLWKRLNPYRIFSGINQSNISLVSCNYRSWQLPYAQATHASYASSCLIYDESYLRWLRLGYTRTVRLPRFILNMMRKRFRNNFMQALYSPFFNRCFYRYTIC